MNHKQSHLLFFYFAATVMIFSGCVPPQIKPTRVCPGRKTATGALLVLMSRTQNIAGLRANGQCLLEYYVEGKKHKENFPVKLWLNPVRGPGRQKADIIRFAPSGASPPVEIYLQGDIAFDPRGIVLGSNEREFWLSIKPQDISSYWWGLWSEESYSERLVISPKITLEALGIAAVGSDPNDAKNWSLSKEGGVDILTQHNDKGQIIKKLYIDRCDYLIRKIEYFYLNDEPLVAAELEKYKEVIRGFFVPSGIKITKRAGVNKGDSVRITLESIKTADFSQKLRERLFTRPDPQGFKHIYKVVDGRILEQL